MKLAFSIRAVRAFTRVELILMTAALTLLVLLIGIPSLKRARARAQRITCICHLKNLGLAFRTAAIDSGDFGFRLPRAKGGTAPDATDPAALWRHFIVLSNELSTPRILGCPTDPRRPTSFTWESMRTKDHNRGLSYAMGLDGTEAQPQSILSCDRNLTLDGLPVGMSVLTVRRGDPVRFSEEFHRNAGNVLLGDGSVQQVTNERFAEILTNAVNASKTGTIRLVVP